MQHIFFRSKLPKQYKPEIEQIFYFNPHQRKHLPKIDEAVEVLGIPHLISKGNFLHFTFDHISSHQVLYAFDDESENAHLLGVVMFYRDAPTDIKIMHIAIDENCSSFGEFKEETIAARLVDEVKKISLALKNIDTLTLPYSNFKLKLRPNLILY